MHQLGDHTQCKYEFDDREIHYYQFFNLGVSKECAHEERLKFYGLFKRVNNILTELGHKSQSLEKLTTNMTESANNIMCMMLDSKRKFLGGRGLVHLKGMCGAIQHKSLDETINSRT